MPEPVLGGARLVAFLATSDANRARAFYGDLLGLRLVEETGFALVFDANGMELRVQKTDRVAAPAHTSLGWQVASIREAVQKLAGAGVRFETYGFPEQDADGIWRSPSGTLVAWFKDPDGNLISISQSSKDKGEEP